ncbi:MAG: ABC transporter ATP-binding protein [Bacteroidia bacterium]|nr:ABC transporter ATP-binding protein [Bacteroidia bacterium]
MISVKHLDFTYPGADVPAVKDVSFEVEEGEIFGFLGPSGAGKSTTQKVLIRLLKGFEGEVNVMERALPSWKEDYYEHIGVGFELPNHYTKLSAIENLQFFGSFYKKKVRKPQELLEMVGLGEDGHKKLSEFSKGMKMRLNFIRSFMHNPEILFFDEPTSGLDPGNARIIKDIILDLKNQGKTIFLTTHDMTVADQLCDRLAFMVDGKLALMDSPQSLKIKHGKRLVKVAYGEAESELEFDLDSLGHNEEFLRILKEERLHTIHSEEATLENIFISVTGKSLQ